MRITLPSGTAASLSIPDDVSMGLVIAPDIFGVRPLFDDLVERLAADWQMAVCAVDPFPGRDLPLEPEPRWAVVGELSDDDHLRDLIEGAAATGQERVGLIGFCMGGMYTLKASRSDRFARLVAFYGMIRVPADWAAPATGSPSTTSSAATRTACWRSSASATRTRRWTTSPRWRRRESPSCATPTPNTASPTTPIARRTVPTTPPTRSPGRGSG